jgi:hypothetical protein
MSGAPKLGLTIIVLFWAGVLLTDFPAPFIDDPWYIGSALSLAQHGGYTNPYCEMLARVDSGPGHLFLAYMPVENYLVAGWLSVFGISAASFHVLFTLLAFGVSALVFRLLLATSLSWAAAIAVCAAIYGLLGGCGLRADAFGWLFYLIGFTAWRAPGGLGFFARNLFLALVVITYPSFALLSFLTTAAALYYRASIDKHPRKALMRDVPLAATAYAACFVLFLFLIDGQLSAFLASTIKNQVLSEQGVRDRFQLFTALGLAKWIVAQGSFLIVVVVLWIRHRHDSGDRSRRIFYICALTAFTVLGFASLNSATGAHVWAVGCLLFLIWALVGQDASWRGWLGYGAFFAVVSFGHFHVALQGLLASPPPEVRTREAFRLSIDTLHPTRLYVDGYALRAVYDYHYPPGALAFETSSTTGWGMPKGLDDAPKNAVLVVSASEAFSTPRSPQAGNAARPLVIFGRRVPGVVANPYDLVMVDTR